MTATGPRPRTVRAPHALVASADDLATQAGLATLARGGNAVDAAIATNAAIAVTGPHLCGMGGDLFALVHDGTTHALTAVGRAGSGVDADRLRAEGHRAMPFRHDARTVTVPGCVDGWCTLHERFGRLALAEVLAPAIALAEDGFPASPLLVGSLAMVDDEARRALAELAEQARRPGARVRRPGVARTLRAVAAGGRAAFYEGEFGTGLIGLARGAITAEDLARRQAAFVEPLSVRAWGHELHTVPPPSQGYLALGGAAIAEVLDLPPDSADPRWAHLLIEAATAAGFDRPRVLHDRADGATLVEAIRARAHLVDPERASDRWTPTAGGGTTYLCVVDGDRMGVSLIQSNASGFGSWLVEPATGINLHNRGLGFSLEPGHPAEPAPGRQPPHTLSPLLATTATGELAAVLGTMGGDAQPQVLLQLLVRLLVHDQSPAAALDAGRWALRGPATGFDTWTAGGPPTVMIEGQATPTWLDGLAARGHRVEAAPPYDSGFGHAHVIAVQPDGLLAGGADPRALVGSAGGL